jgi:hypothetical protein
VGIDRFDDADLPSGGRPAGRADPPDDRGRQDGGTPAEARGREEYHAALRAETAAWDASADRFRGLWAEYNRRWPPQERPAADRPRDAPGCWRGEGGRFLDRPVNEQLDRECDRIAGRERDRLTPALREVESQDPDRFLVGLEQRLKGRDRIKEKVFDDAKEHRRTPEEALWQVPDAVRYTFWYNEARYTRGVLADIDRLKERGFELLRLKNSWSHDQYKGINSQWVDADTGQRFEVQFHTRVSFEAKELTHDAYERLRSHQADEFEEMVLEAFQRKVCSAIPVPPGATDIPEYPGRGQHAR